MLIRIPTLGVWTGQPIGNVSYPLNIEQLWTAADLKAIGLVAPLPPVIPDGQQIVGAPTYVLEGDLVKTVYSTEALPFVPLRATRRQFMLALFNAGLLDQAEAIAVNHPYRPVRIEWENATEFVEDSPTLSALLIEINKTDADLHDLMLAAQLL